MGCRYYIPIPFLSLEISQDEMREFKLLAIRLPLQPEESILLDKKSEMASPVPRPFLSSFSNDHRHIQLAPSHYNLFTVIQADGNEGNPY